MILKDRIAIVTGQSRGLGKAIAQAFRDEGAIVPDCSRDQVDLLNDRDVASFIGKFEKIDILVNNAAILGPVGNLQDCNYPEMVFTLDVNLWAPICLAQRCLPALLKSSRGKIINICGGGASTPLPRRIAYAVSKAGLARFSDSLAEELKDTNIDCNAVLPGAMKTAMIDEMLSAGPERLGKEEFEQHSAVTRGPEKAAELCVYLASSASNGLRGKLISANHDPWPFNSIEEVMQSDKYTLRRING